MIKHVDMSFQAKLWRGISLNDFDRGKVGFIQTGRQNGSNLIFFLDFPPISTRKIKIINPQKVKAVQEKKMPVGMSFHF